MKIEKESSIILRALGLIVVGLLLSFAFVVHTTGAAASFFVASSPTASATTSPAYMTAGAGTSTVSFAIQTGTLQGVDAASLLTQYTPSTTASVLNINLEYSQNGIDWYSDNIYEPVISTTTTKVTLNSSNVYSLTGASSTIDGVGLAGGATTMNRIISVPTPTAYVRAVYTITGGNGAVWGQFIGTRQTSGN